MIDSYFTAFLIGYASMFTAHYAFEPTFGEDEPRPRAWRMLFNYAVGVGGISMAFLYLHPEMWLSLFVCVAGAAMGTVVGHGRDWAVKMWRRDRLHGLVEERKNKA